MTFLCGFENDWKRHESFKLQAWACLEIVCGVMQQCNFQEWPQTHQMMAQDNYSRKA